MTCPRVSDVDCPPPSPVTAVASEGRQPLQHGQIRRIIFGIMLAMFLGALEQTIVATALPTMGAAFGDVVNLSWVVTAYLLACTVATPLYGKLSDIHGRRVMLLVSVAVFTLASVGCALAPNLLVLALARGLQGLGGGGLISLSQTIIADVVAPRERGRYQAQIATVFAASSVAGPVLGGLIAEHAHWSLIFWLNVPLGVLAFVITGRALRDLPRHERHHRMDYLGAGLMAVASVSLLLALSWGGVRYAWGSPLILGLLTSAGGFCGLFLWRMRATPEPFLPLDLLADPVVSKAIPAVALAAGAMVGLCIFVPLYFETVRGLSAGQSGLGLIPLVGGIVCGATLTGRAMVRIAHYKRPALGGALLGATALGGLALAPRTLPIEAVTALLALVGMGIGSVLPVCTVAIQNAVVQHRMGLATGAMTFFRQLSGAAAVAVLGAVLLAISGISGAGGFERLGRGGAPAAALDLGFQAVFAAVAAMLLVSLACLMVMEQRPLRTSVRAAAEEGALGPE